MSLFLIKICLGADQSQISFINESLHTESIEDREEFTGVLTQLDWSWHNLYVDSTKVVEHFYLAKKMIQSGVSDRSVVFAAGIMGAGKGNIRKGPSCKNHIIIDLDEIREYLTSYKEVSSSIDRASAIVSTKKETGLVGEIVTLLSLVRGFNIFIDGTLKDRDHHRILIEKFKRSGFKIAVHYVSTPLIHGPRNVFDNIFKRVDETGRMIPWNIVKTYDEDRKFIEESIKILFEGDLIEVVVIYNNKEGFIYNISRGENLNFPEHPTIEEEELLREFELRMSKRI